LIEREFVDFLMPIVSKSLGQKYAILIFESEKRSTEKF